MIESNSIIKASAGTGKTFALATRFIRQMLIDKVDPQTIVALTFSRAAAQEIYTKILMRLCAAATDADGANGEWKTLLEDFQEDRVPDEKKEEAKAKLAWIESQKISHTAADFRELLRKLVDTQHLGAIATLDSFILRIVRNFPKEMGFQNAVEVLDPIDEDEAVDEAVRLLMSKTDETGANVAQAFTAANRGEFSRTCLSAIGYILNKSGWRNFVVSHPECKDWTVESMCAALGVPLESECPDLSGLPFNEIHRRNAVSCEEQFVRFAKKCDGSLNPMDAGDKVVALMRHFWGNPDATSYEYEYYNATYTFDCGADGAAAVRGAIAHIMNLYLKRQVEIVKAKIDLVKAIDSVYERQTRRAGKLTFADFTTFSAEHEFSERGIAIQNVQFRFDSKFDHWALDEFQDTSELQWKCLNELVKNVADAGRAGDARSAMAVGDLKQSIYTWRGASARPFEQLAGWKAFEGCNRDLKESHRYGPNTVYFVNRVFGKENISPNGIIPSVCKGAVDDWSKGWVDHVSKEAPDYVRVVGAKESADPEGGDDAILSALYGELGPLWDRHCAENSPDTVGILVRNNDSGLAVAEYLRAKGLPVVWEGMSHVHDIPVVEAVLSLLRLADHPDDCYAWRTVNDLFPIRELVLPRCVDAASVSAEVSRMLSKQGLSRTLKDICGILREKGGLSPTGLSCERLKQLVEMGVNCDERGAALGIDGFVRFLAKAQKREIAVSSDVIRIMTIHRSKGLGVDHVFVPLFENRSSSAIDAPKATMPLYAGGNWVLSHLKKGSEFFNEKTRAAYEKMRSDHLMEALRTYYVALTRSKKSLFVVFPEESKPEAYKSGLLMRDLIMSAVGPTLPYEAGIEPSFKSEKKSDERSEGQLRDVWANAGTREIIERCSPSASSHSVGHAPKWMKASSLFAADHGAAAQRGLDVHAAYQKIEWADREVAATLPPTFTEAFVKPSDDAAVWRERGYELFDGNRWETGRFDRVVFKGADGSRSAIIYDFKTNAKGGDEDDAAFSRRMCELYNSQMKSYRRALARLTGIPVDRIETKLLLEATGQVAIVR